MIMELCIFGLIKRLTLALIPGPQDLVYLHPGLVEPLRCVAKIPVFYREIFDVYNSIRLPISEWAVKSVIKKLVVVVTVSKSENFRVVFQSGDDNVVEEFLFVVDVGEAGALPDPGQHVGGGHGLHGLVHVPLGPVADGAERERHGPRALLTCLLVLFDGGHILEELRDYVAWRGGDPGRSVQIALLMIARRPGLHGGLAFGLLADRRSHRRRNG